MTIIALERKTATVKEQKERIRFGVQLFIRRVCIVHTSMGVCVSVADSVDRHSNACTGITV